MEVPSHFHLTLAGRKPCRSSAFTIRYEIGVDVPDNHVAVALWRKNDHDKFSIDTLAGTYKGTTQHYMCGEKPFEKPLGFNVPLVETLDRWVGHCEPVFEQTDRFWRTPE